MSRPPTTGMTDYEIDSTQFFGTNNINDINGIKLINEDNDNEINEKVRICTC